MPLASFRMAELRYDPQEIEPRWQRVWADERTWEVSNEPDERPQSSYVLEMLPYPSGEPHIGHLKTYSVGDAIAHFHRRTGRRVLHPMGYDAFGLPAENHAIKTGEHPRESTAQSIEAFQQQFREWGISIDWSREFGTHEPRYYRWTQWIFLQLLRARPGLPQGGGGQVVPATTRPCWPTSRSIDGRCERCGHEVEVRQLEQWFFRITDYADRLLDDLDDDRLARARQDDAAQLDRALARAPRSTFRCEELGIDYPVFTTRPDTLFGATFFVMAPEHPDVVPPGRGHRARAGRARVRQPRADTSRTEERGDADKPKTGVAARPHRDQPGQRRADPDVRRRLRADGVRHRRDHGRARPRRARLRLRRRPSTCRSAG